MQVDLDSVSGVIRSACDVSAGQPLDHGTLADLGLDSLAQLKLLFALEKRFDVRLSEDTDFAAMSLSDLVALIRRAGGGPPAVAPPVAGT
jgi:acyl carrier protein